VSLLTAACRQLSVGSSFHFSLVLVDRCQLVFAATSHCCLQTLPEDFCGVRKDDCMEMMSICLSITNISETVCRIFMKFSIKICAARMSFVKIRAVKGICYLQAEFKILLIFSIFFV
jgi:hypothetical protein